LIGTWNKQIILFTIISGGIAFGGLVATQKIMIAVFVFPLIFLAMLVYADMDVNLEYSYDIPDRIRVGEEFEVSVEIRIKGGYGMINLSMPTYDEMEIMDGTNVHVFYKGFKERKENFTYKGKAMRRGVFQWAPLKVDFNPLVGTGKTRKYNENIEKSIQVDPEIKMLKKSQFLIKTRKPKPRSSMTRLGPPTTDFESIREYAPGDPFKSINWKASARVQFQKGLMVNQYEREGMKTYIFYLDTSMLMRRGTEYENPLEYAISLILSGANYLISRGYNVGYWPISSRMVRRQDFVVPSSGTDTFNQIKKILLRVESSRIITSSYPVDKTMARLVLETKARIAVITSIDERNRVLIEELRRKLISLGGTVTIVNIRPEGIVAKRVDQRIQGLFSYSSKLKNKDKYPGNVVWDPVNESLGHAALNLGRLSGW
jgi:uncharacterized protein (DUF58 family)